MFIDDNFNAEGQFFQLFDRIKSNNKAKKMGTIVISLHTKECNLVKITLENIASLNVPSVYFLCISWNCKKGQN